MGNMVAKEQVMILFPIRPIRPGNINEPSWFFLLGGFELQIGMEELGR